MPSENIHKWHTIEKELLVDNSFMKVARHKREQDVTNERADYFLLEAPDWANIIAVTREQKVILIRQFRQGTEEIELEIPGGIIDHDELPERAILRELEEETGYIPSEDSTLELLGTVHPNPAFLKNRCFFYFLSNAKPGGHKHFDAHEQIEAELVDLGVIDDLIRFGEISHALVVAAFHYYHLSGR